MTGGPLLEAAVVPDLVVAAVAVAAVPAAAPRVGGRLLLFAVLLLPVDEDCAEGGRKTGAEVKAMAADGGLESGLDGGLVVVVADDVDEVGTIDADLFRVWPRSGPDVAAVGGRVRLV